MHFSLGKDFGQTLAQIAYEHLTEGNLQKAIDVYKEALIGIGDEHVVLLLKGEGVVEVADDNVTVTLVDYDPEKHANYLIYHVANELPRRFKDALNFRCLKKLQEYVPFIGTSGTDYHIKQTVNLDPEFDTSAYIEITAQDMHDKIVKYQWLDDPAKNKRGNETWNRLKTWAEDDHNKLLAQTLYAIDEVRRNIHDISSLFEIADYFGYEIDGETKNKVRDYLMEVKVHFFYEPMPSIFDKHIYPCYRKYDAGFIAPNGDVYGMDGETSTLIHLTLSDKLAQDFDLSEYQDWGVNNNDYALDKAGWVKFHYDTFNKYSHRKNHITDAQADTIAKYATDFLDGIIGFEHNTTTVAKWKQMDNIMREEQFA